MNTTCNNSHLNVPERFECFQEKCKCFEGVVKVSTSNLNKMAMIEEVYGDLGNLSAEDKDGINEVLNLF